MGESVAFACASGIYFTVSGDYGDDDAIRSIICVLAYYISSVEYTQPDLGYSHMQVLE